MATSPEYCVGLPRSGGRPPLFLGSVMDHNELPVPGLQYESLDDAVRYATTLREEWDGGCCVFELTPDGLRVVWPEGGSGQ